MSDDSSKQLEPKKPVNAARGVLEGLFVPFVAVLASGLLLGVGIGFLGVAEDSLTAAGELWIAALAVSLPAVLVALYISGVRRLPLLEALKLSRPNRRQLIKLLQGIGWYMLLSLSLMVLAQAFLSGFDAAEEQDLGFTAPDSVVRLATLFLLLAVLTPIAEEILFRGFMFPGMAKSWGWLPAAIVSSVLFGLLHGQYNVALDTAAMGFVSAHLRHSTGSLTPSILLHTIKNTVAFGLVFLLPLL